MDRIHRKHKLTVLVTGSEGFIGTRLKRKLHKFGYHVLIFDKSFGLDILNRGPLNALSEYCDIIIHLAANSVVSESWRHPIKYFLNNVIGTWNVVRCGKPVIFASSGTAKEPMYSPYGLTKRVGEILNRRGISFRIHNVYGGKQNDNYKRAIDAFARGAVSGEITVYGDGSNVRDFIHIDDVCDAFVSAVKKAYRGESGIYDLGSGEQTKIIDVANTFLDIYKYKPKIVFKRGRAEQKVSVADPTSLKSEFGIYPRTGVLNWVRRNYGL